MSWQQKLSRAIPFWYEQSTFILYESILDEKGNANALLSELRHEKESDEQIILYIMFMAHAQPGFGITFDDQLISFARLQYTKTEPTEMALLAFCTVILFEKIHPSYMDGVILDGFKTAYWGTRFFIRAAQIKMGASQPPEPDNSFSFQQGLMTPEQSADSSEQTIDQLQDAEVVKTPARDAMYPVMRVFFNNLVKNDIKIKNKRRVSLFLRCLHSVSDDKITDKEALVQLKRQIETLKTMDKKEDLQNFVDLLCACIRNNDLGNEEARLPKRQRNAFVLTDDITQRVEKWWMAWKKGENDDRSYSSYLSMQLRPNELLTKYRIHAQAQNWQNDVFLNDTASKQSRIKLFTNALEPLISKGYVKKYECRDPQTNAILKNYLPL